MLDLVSIIMPVYNTKAYLEKAVRSVMDQTWQNWELLLVDDGSTDGSADLCDRLAGQDKRIRVFHQENHGVSVARNTGLEAAVGSAIAFLDSDDYYEPSCLETLLDMQKKAGDIPVCCAFFEERSGGTQVPAKALPQKQLPMDDFLYEVFLGTLSLPVCIATWLLPASAACRHRFDESLRFGEDSLYISEILAEYPEVYYDPVPLYHYRIEREGNTVNEHSFRKSQNAFRSDLQIYRAFCGKLRKTEQVLLKHLVEDASACARYAAREGLSSEAGLYRKKAFCFWKKMIQGPDISRHDKIRLLGYSLFPRLSEKIMLRIYGRV